MGQDVAGAPYDRASLADRGLAIPPFNLDLILDHAALAHPAAIWIADRGAAALSYGEADQLVGRMAATLIALGVKPDDRAAVLIPNHPAFVVAIWGGWRAGAICSAMHPAYAEPTLAAQLEDCEPTCLITINEPGLLAKAERLSAARGLRLIALPAFDDLGMALEPESAAPCRADPDSLALLQYTGGTTGGVKAAMLTHAGLSHNIGQLCQTLPALEYGAETILAVAPFAHITGFQLLCQSGYLGARVVLENRFDADRTARLCLDERVSFFTCVPTVMEGLNRSSVAQTGDWSALKYVISGGAPLPGATRTRFEGMTGCQLLGGYGLSEASPAVLLGFGKADAPPESVGPPLPGTRIAISATDDPAHFLDMGATGEIRIAGPQIMQGYWRKPEESAAALEGGMLRTGDVGHIAADGRVHVSSRLKDLIIASGYNIYPSRVEDAIFTHDAVADVAVIGVPHDYRGETVKAVVVTKPGRTLTLDELQAWLKPRLSPMEMPKLLELRDALPKSPAGKTLKIALREEAVPA